MTERISGTVIKALFAASGGICAYPGCRQPLIEPETSTDKSVVIGEIAHIVAEDRQGPRGDGDFDETRRNSLANLILLCPTHHTRVDTQPRTFTVAVLRQMKADHENSIRQRLGLDQTVQNRAFRTEGLLSTLLPVTRLPTILYAAECAYSDDELEQVRQLIKYPNERGKLTPFSVHEHRLFAFHDLGNPEGPFAGVIAGGKVERHPAQGLWKDPDWSRRYVELLNSGLRRFTSTKGLRYDREHRRYYFVPRNAGEQRSVRYTSRQGKKVRRSVVWRPVTVATGQPKGFWWHLAVALHFHHVARGSWCLSVRPERRLTVDGETLVPPERIGRRVTKLKARMHNDLYLNEVNFWRSYLSDARPRIILDFGDQNAVIDTDLVTVSVASPGIPGDDKPFKSQHYSEDLFSLADLRALDEAEDEETELEPDEEPEGDDSVPEE